MKSVTPKELLKLLQSHGFQVIRSKGSHQILRHLMVEEQ